MSNQHLDAASGSGPSLLPTKAIGSLAKKQPDVTRQGTQKLKFIPTLPTRRKKDEIKTEPTTPAVQIASSSEPGRGRGRGDSRGRGRGRGASRPPVVEMTASGPFAMGPALPGNNARRAVPRYNFIPNLPPSSSGSSLGGTLSHTAVPSPAQKNNLKGNKREKTEIGEEEVYSDPDEGVEIVDMENVHRMDWMAPESLRKERRAKKAKQVKKEEPSEDPAIGGVDLTNALDLSESDEEELEDIIEDFAVNNEMGLDPAGHQEPLYYFQFPSPFPAFVSTSSVIVPPAGKEPNTEVPTKKVSFANDVKHSPKNVSAPDLKKQANNPQPRIDGTIGQLEVYRSGTIKMRLANGILFDVHAATQPSFFQQAICLDETVKRLSVLGEVNKRYIVSPHVETLLAAMEMGDQASTTFLNGEDDLIQMDIT